MHKIVLCLHEPISTSILRFAQHFTMRTFRAIPSYQLTLMREMKGNPSIFSNSKPYNACSHFVTHFHEIQRTVSKFLSKLGFSQANINLSIRRPPVAPHEHTSPRPKIRACTCPTVAYCLLFVVGRTCLWPLVWYYTYLFSCPCCLYLGCPVTVAVQRRHFT